MVFSLKKVVIGIRDDAKEKIKTRIKEEQDFRKQIAEQKRKGRKLFIKERKSTLLNKAFEDAKKGKGTSGFPTIKEPKRRLL
jgi:hypothetical protein